MDEQAALNQYITKLSGMSKKKLITENIKLTRALINASNQVIQLKEIIKPKESKNENINTNTDNKA